MMLISLNPATNAVIWQGKHADAEAVNSATQLAKNAFPLWSSLPFETRASFLKSFAAIVTQKEELLAQILSEETGKNLSESHAEVKSVIAKVTLSIEAIKELCAERHESTERGELFVKYKPHGTIAVFGPFNFPLHLPHGHILPALLAGNCVIFKASEHTPLISETIMKCWQEVDLPKGVLTLLQGGRETGELLASRQELDGLFFTGSFPTGLQFCQQFSTHPEKILALEMGGNNPLVIADIEDVKQVVDETILSAYLTTGQRCSCARRLIVIENDEFLKRLIDRIKEITVGDYKMHPEPFMGPLIDLNAMRRVLEAQERFKQKGGRPLVEMRQLREGLPFVSAGLIDMTEVANREDEEIFGPLLQLIRVKSFEEALEEAKRTEYGLTAGLFSKSRDRFERFFHEIKAGVINWNTPITQASSKAPFGGVGKSGNHRSSAYFAAHYCSYPVTSLQRRI